MNTVLNMRCHKLSRHKGNIIITRVPQNYQNEKSKFIENLNNLRKSIDRLIFKQHKCSNDKHSLLLPFPDSPGQFVTKNSTNSMHDQPGPHQRSVVVLLK